MKDDVMVTIEHPHGTIQVPLSTWIEEGPGERELLAPSGVIDSKGNKLPMRTIPFKYRNNLISRALIKSGLMTNPWTDKNK